MSSTPVKIAVMVAFAATLVAVVYLVTMLKGGDGGGGLVQIGGPFTLVDQNGRQRSDTDFRGRYMLIYFGYTSCPDVCPTDLADMGLVMDALGERGAKVQPLFITIDPARDTPERLKSYLANFNPKIVALTGSEQAIAAAAKAYRVYYSKIDAESAPGQYLMDHTAIIYLMGPDGRYLTHFTHGTSVQNMAERIREQIS